MSQLDLKTIFDMPKEEALNVLYDRRISIPITSIMSLQRELETTVGKDRAKGIFIRYGWHNGVSDAKKVQVYSEWRKADKLIWAGSMLHKLHGYVKEVTIDEIKYDKDKEIERIDIRWFESFEVDEYVQSGNWSDRPVCHTMCGYTSGYLSTIFNRSILVVEQRCRAMGHDCCEVVCIPMEKENDKLASEYKYYQATSMIQELDEVTAKLKRERDRLSKAYNIHQQLITELISKKGLHHIVQTVYKKTGVHTFIEDERKNILAKSRGFNFTIDTSSMNDSATSFKKLDDDIGLLRTPIYFEDKIKGYCTFVFTDRKKPSALDYMIIEQVSLTASITLLNESIKINTEFNIRRDFLNDVLKEKLKKDEVYKYAQYLQLNPEDAYWMFTLERAIDDSKNLKKEIQRNETLIRHIHSFFSDHHIHVTVSQIDMKIIVLVEQSSFQRLLISRESLIDELLVELKQTINDTLIYVGVSSIVDHIYDICILYEESLAALKAKQDRKSIYFYEDLELESLLFQVPDESLIDRFVQRRLGKLLEEDKDFELIKTFYAFVENGINIKNTAKAIAMSVSGLRYRLDRISEILDLDYDDTKSVLSVYMAIKVLIAKGRVQI